jgi:5-carboxymethyl-2-hydroxymuconate isomerase
MPHIVIEYSGNLSPHVNWAELARRLHGAASEMPELPLSGLRTRARQYDDYVIADGNPEAGFVHVTLRMGHGRSEEAKLRIGDHLFGALCYSLETAYQSRPLSITLEIQEIHPVFNYRKSNLRSYVEAAPGDGGADAAREAAGLRPASS